MITRRRLLKAASAGAALTGSGVSFLQLSEAGAAGLDLPAELPEGTRAGALLDVLPGKKPLIKLTYRPPNYETPIEFFRGAITPNDAFYVRYHLSDIPQVDAKTRKLSVGGEGANAQATNKIGQSQTAELIPNPGGYHHNLMHRIALTVT